MVVSPYTPGIVIDPSITAQLAEVGVALLLFGVGLHFRLPDLLAVWRVAIPGALGQVAIGTGLGALVGCIELGLPLGSALAFGLALAIASTAIATRLLTDRGQMNGEAGRIALGWLVLQDLLVVFALVLLPALDGDGGSVPSALARAVMALAGFVLAMALIGRRALPWLLVRAARSGSRELFTLAVAVAALGVSWGAAELFSVSIALGAFFAGVVLGETEISHQAAARALPLEQVFSVVFFVSIGMQVRPEAVLEAP
jgi:monovalent cation:H+ antiporter-2, CPA2 family